MLDIDGQTWIKLAVLLIHLSLICLSAEPNGSDILKKYSLAYKLICYITKNGLENDLSADLIVLNSFVRHEAGQESCQDVYRLL